jgi:hypothetical protein
MTTKTVFVFGRRFAFLLLLDGWLCRLKSPAHHHAPDAVLAGGHHLNAGRRF